MRSRAGASAAAPAARDCPGRFGTQENPWRGNHFDDGTNHSSSAGSALPSMFSGTSGQAIVGADSGLAGTEAEQDVVAALLSPDGTRLGHHHAAGRPDAARNGGEPTMSTRSSLVKFIVFVVATLLATGTLAATIANTQFGDKATYRAVFEDVTGLAPGQEVRIAGVRVGEVKSIAVASDRVHATVDFNVLKTSVLTQGTKATIKYRNLVGERYIALTQDVGGATPLKDGATLGLDHTQSALDLTVLFNGFKPLFAALSPKDVNELSTNIISVLQGEGGNINSLLSKTASLTSTLADRDEVIGRTIANLNTVLGTVDAHDAALKELIDQLQRFISGLAADRDDDRCLPDQHQLADRRDR